MIQKYIIDGNNLIGKIKSLWKLQKSDKQMSRVKLVIMIDQHFASKKIEISLHFDGFQNDPIPSAKSKLYYSNKSSADSKIRKEIDLFSKPKNIAE